MRQFQLSDTKYSFSLDMTALRRLDQLRPGMDMGSLRELAETTAGLLDLCQAMTGENRDKLAILIIKKLNALPDLRETLLKEIADGLRVETTEGDTNREVDVTLEQLMANEAGGRLTYRRLTFMGLLAGLSFEEMGPLMPGMVCDLYAYRMKYDDEQHGIKRKQREIYD